MSYLNNLASKLETEIAIKLKKIDELSNQIGDRKEALSQIQGGGFVTIEPDDDWHTENSRLNEKVDALETEKKVLEGQIESTKTESSKTLDEALSSLGTTTDTLKTKATEIKELKSQISKQKAENTKLKKQVKALTAVDENGG